MVSNSNVDDIARVKAMSGKHLSSNWWGHPRDKLSFWACPFWDGHRALWTVPAVRSGSCRSFACGRRSSPIRTPRLIADSLPWSPSSLLLSFVCGVPIAVDDGQRRWGIKWFCLWPVLYITKCALLIRESAEIRTVKLCPNEFERTNQCHLLLPKYVIANI